MISIVAKSLSVNVSEIIEDNKAEDRLHQIKETHKMLSIHNEKGFNYQRDRLKVSIKKIS